MVIYMKRRFVFFYAIFTILIIISFIFIAYYMDKAAKESKKEEIKQNLEEIKKYVKDNKIPDMVRVKITKTGEVKTMTVNEYLKGVVPSEMPPSFNMEALKAQAVVARTYLYQKIVSGGGHTDADICDSPSHCQAYYPVEKIQQIWEGRGYDEATRKEYLSKVVEAVESTSNVAVTYKGEYIKAYFHANSGGKTEDVSSIWGKKSIPYLVSVESLGEEAHKYYKSEVDVTVAQLQEKINNSLSVPCSISEDAKNAIKIISYTKTGRADKVEIGGSIYDATQLRTALDLKSTNFTISVKGSDVIFNVTGYGHGVGMSQTRF